MTKNNQLKATQKQKICSF